MPAGRPAGRELPDNFVAHLGDLAVTRPNDIAIIVARSDEDTIIRYAELDERVRALAADLQWRFEPGARVLLLLENDDHYVVGFLACLYAGLIAVPAFPPESTHERHLARLRAIARDAQARCVLATGEGLESIRSARDLFDDIDTVVLDAAGTLTRADRYMRHVPGADDVAFLQYTSGSTAAPKGVVITHGNLIANERAIEVGMSIGADDRFVSWLPLFHDMGLVGGLLQPLHRGIPLVLMSPASFLERPVRWLEQISRHRGTISGGPDFAYRLCLERISDAQLRSLDLSSWRVAFSGAEPVRLDTLNAFAERFAAAGFDAKAIYPCYGLAEAALFVTGGRRHSGMVAKTFSSEQLAKGQAVVSRREGTTLVACGTTHADHRVEITDCETSVKLPDGRVGEIQVSGPSVSRGYWQLDRESAETYVERDGARWLRTGDLGFVRDKQLYITGRQKDLLILRGKNVYPQDLERAIEAEIEAVRKGRVAVFAVHGEAGESVGVAVEVSPRLQKLIPPERLVEELGAVVSDACHEPLAVVVLLNAGALPKTSSGKLQRSACRQGWRNRTLDAYAMYENGRFVLGGSTQTPLQTLENDVERGLAAIWQEVLRGTAYARDSHFFVSGGNSLTAAQVTSRIRDRWGIDFPLRDLFERPRLGDLADEINRRSAAGERRAVASIDRLSAELREQPLPLSHGQERLWFLWQLDPTNTAYHISARFRFSGNLDVEALRTSFAAIVARHESLRTVFRAGSDGQPRQLVLPACTVDIPLVDARAVSAQDHLVADETRRILETPFDLNAAPLLRAGVIQLDDAGYLLVLAIHHIISDGWSMQVMFDELSAQYAARVQGLEAPKKPPLTVQYVDYASWQRRWLSQGEQDRQLAWWRDELGDEHPVVELPVDHPRQASTAYRPERHELSLPQELVLALRSRAAGQGVTVFAVLLASFQTLLHRYTRQRDIRIGVPVANRDQVSSEGIIGFFVNTLVMRTCIDDDIPLLDVLARTAEAVRGAQAHQDLPFEQLVEALHPGRDLSQSPLFRVVMNHQQADDRSMKRWPDLRLEDYWVGKQAAQFELALDTVESADGDLLVRFTYAAGLFEADTIARLAGHFLRVLEALAHKPETRVRDVELLSPEETTRLREWSVNGARHAGFRPVHRLFEEQVVRDPDAVALVCGTERLSYEELNRRSNQLAHHLISLGVKPETRVGLAAERSVEMIVGLMGILKAGGAYVPFDPEYPADRLRYMFEDSGVALLLTQSRFEERFADYNVSTVIALEAPDLSREPEHDPDVELHGDNAIYLIYTSGSTGRPKGAANRHRSLFNRLMWAQQFDPLRADDVVLQKTPFSFDISFWEIFWPLSSGATLVMARPGEHRDSARLVEIVRQHGVTTIHFVPSMLQAFVASDAVGSCRSLRRMICSGEALPAETQRRVFSRLPWVNLFNLYGPTEAAIEVTYWKCSEENRTTVPIGRPVSDTRTLILDAGLNAAPQGAIGELYLGGMPLALGYPTQPGLSADRFVADPFDADGGRLYRTGDLARWRSDGQIEYVGRVDHQVKIRGHRIELGEIEAQLLAQPDVREAVVLVREDQRIVAYVVPDVDALKRVDSTQTTSRDALLTQWGSVFDTAYTGNASGPDFRGWVSSYTEEPIPEGEMREWLQGTVHRIRSLAPRSVLEVGCGVGLIVRELAPHVPVYRATDLSARAVQDLAAWLTTQHALTHVEVRQSEAADFEGIEAGDFDMVVLNSVIQYFPDVDYLLEVLKGAAQVVGPQGRLFIGDVRHVAHLPMFHASVQLAKAPAELTVRQLKSRIAKAVAQDKELVLDPSIFPALAKHLRMGEAQVQLKRGSSDNELMRYRYDVVLRGETSLHPDPVSFDVSAPGALAGLTKLLASRCAPVVSLRGVPNRRLARDVAAWRLVQTSDDQLTVAELRARLNEVDVEGVDPESFWSIGDEQGYDVRVRWSDGSAEGSMDVDFIDRDCVTQSLVPSSGSFALPPQWRSLASDPLRTLRAQQLGARWREQLSARLPEYMVPSHFALLDALPLTANGKLNRKALPEPERLAAGRYEAPRGPAENALATLWEEVLGVSRVGRLDNFFEIGGHSLIANQVSVLMAQRHGCDLPVRYFFERHTLKELASELDPQLFDPTRTRSRRLSAMASLLNEVS